MNNCCIGCQTYISETLDERGYCPCCHGTYEAGGAAERKAFKQLCDASEIPPEDILSSTYAHGV